MRAFVRLSLILLSASVRCLGSNSSESVGGRLGTSGAALVVQKAFEDQQQHAQAKAASSTPQQLPTLNVLPVARSPSAANNNNVDNVCPAVKAPGSNVYIAYNPSLQAATLDEVVTFFVDPVVDDPALARTLTGVRPDARDAYKFARGEAKLCLDKECLGCVDLLAEILKTRDARAKNATGLNNAVAMAAALGMGDAKGNLKQYCQRLHHLLPPTPPTLARVSKRGRGKESPTPTAAPTPAHAPRQMKNAEVSRLELDDILEKIKPDPAGRRRTRRQPNGKDKASGAGDYDNRPGVATPLDCNYKRGDRTNDSSQTAGLCNLCWSLRTLPGRYFPRYVNELSCDASDQTCLSGYGACRERYRSVDVLYNHGAEDAPKWTQYSVNTAVACECRVQLGSALHNLVSR